MVKVDPDVGAVMATLLTEVAVANPRVGVTNVGLVSMTNLVPVPVWEAMEVALPTLVIGPVKLAFVVTVAALPEIFPVTLPVRLPITFPDTFPLRGPEKPEAVMVPAIKPPLLSRATMVETVLAAVAVVAELLIFPDVEMVASLVSAMAAMLDISALTISPLSILAEVIELSAKSAVTISPSKILALVTASAAILAVVMARLEMTGAVAAPPKSPAN